VQLWKKYFDCSSLKTLKTIKVSCTALTMYLRFFLFPLRLFLLNFLWEQTLNFNRNWHARNKTGFNCWARRRDQLSRSIFHKIDSLCCLSVVDSCYGEERNQTTKGNSSHNEPNSSLFLCSSVELVVQIRRTKKRGRKVQQRSRSGNSVIFQHDRLVNVSALVLRSEYFSKCTYLLIY